MTKILQNFFKTTVSVAWGTGTGNLYIATKPTSNTAGWLVVSPNSASLREIVAYSGTGTDGTGDYIVCTARGVGGTTAQIHAIAEPVRMNITAEHWADIFVNPTFTGTVTVPTPVATTDAATKAYVDGVAIAGGADASTTVKGISKASVAPASATDPIFVGDNDPRVPTQGENDALAGTSGTPSSSNKFVTADDPLKGSPTGMVSPYAGSSAPTGWLLADGTAVSRTTYASLFAVVSTTYGVGDGSTTFNVPNLKGKIPVGYNTAETEFDALGETGGEKTHLLTGAESGTSAHSHIQRALSTAAGGSGSIAVSSTYSATEVNSNSTANSTEANASSAHNNLQPYIALNYIIKT